MPEDTTVEVPQGETPEPVAETTQASANSETPQAHQTEPEQNLPTGPDGKPFDPDRAMATIQKLRSEEKRAKELEKELEKYQAAEKAREREKMSEIERLQAELADIQAERQKLEQQAQDAVAVAQKQAVENAIIKAAGDKFLDVNDVIMALNGKVEVNEDGEPTGISEALEALAKNKPHWVRKAKPNVLPTNPGNGATAGDTEAQIRNLIYGGNGRNFMTAEMARNHGGGVVFSGQTE